MDATAIQAIQKLAVSEFAQQELTAADDHAVILPDGYKVNSLEFLNDTPRLFRGKFLTNVIGDFIRYVIDNATEDSAIFIDKDNMAAKAILDMGNPVSPEWGKHNALAKLEKLPPYVALLTHREAIHGQQDFIDFAEDWREHVVFKDEQGEDIDFNKAINTLRKLKIEAKGETEQVVSNFSSSRSAMEQVEAKASEGTLPAGFTFTCNPYEGFAAQAFTAQIRASNSDNGVKLKYRIGQLEAMQIAIADEFRGIIVNALQDNENTKDVSVYLGNMDYQA